MSTDLWLRSFSPAEAAAVQLVCFPHAGGSASYFRQLSVLLGPSIDVRAVQYPGRQDRRREPMPSDLQTLASSISTVLQQSRAGAYAFFGHSMGAIVAYEAARALGSDRRPSALFVSGRRAPSTYRPDDVHSQDEEGLIRTVLSLGGTESAALLDADIRELVMPVIRQDYRLVETYRHRSFPKLDLPITVLFGEQDQMTTIDEAHTWEQHTSGTFTLHRFPGGHFFLNDHLEAVAEIISNILHPKPKVQVR